MNFSRRAFSTGLASLCIPKLSWANQKPIRIGLTPVFLDDDHILLSTFQNYLSHAIGRDVQIIKRRTYQEITDMLVSGQLDAAWMCGFPFVQNKENLRLLAIPVYKGKPLYQSYVIANADGPATTFEDLENGIHAFSDPNSNSGYLVTLELLYKLNIKPNAFFQNQFFTYGHRNVIRAVASGLADSGSVDGYVWDMLAQTHPSLVGRTKIIRKSELMGFPPFASNAANHRSPIIQKLELALWEMDKDPDGQKVLQLLGLDRMERANKHLFGGIEQKVETLTAKGWL